MIKGPLLAVVGPTASGKTSLSLELARKYKGEIICADSRTIYKHMDIGTAKPTRREQAAVPHHLLDVVEPNQRFTVADFQQQAQAAIKDIQGRGRLPILVGGTGLYVDAVLYSYSFRADVQLQLRAELEGLSLERLHQRAEERGLELNDSDRANSRRLIRALETSGQRPSRAQLPDGVLVIGLDPGMEALERSIAKRTRGYFEDGLQQETAQLLEQYGNIEPLNTAPYREVINGESEELINLHLRQLAKRQLTWFKRNPDIHWAKTSKQALELAEEFIAKRL